MLTHMLAAQSPTLSSSTVLLKEPKPGFPNIPHKFRRLKAPVTGEVKPADSFSSVKIPGSLPARPNVLS